MIMNDEYLRSYADAGLYTMQGRLSAPEDGRFQSFPRAGWQNEIRLAPEVPLRGIEWIVDLYGEGANPLESREGRAQLQTHLASPGIGVKSICADYFMDCPLVRVDAASRAERLARLRELVSICPEMSITRIVLPFVDASRMNGTDDIDKVLQSLHDMLPAAASAGVELHLETDLPPREFRAFLDEIPSDLVKVNYDAGNSAALGYRPKDEFDAYGHRVGSFHIKDRKTGGGTVPLGTGDTDFASLRQALIDFEYRGDFVLQVARGPAGSEVDWLRRYASIACEWLRGENLLARKESV
jgi:hexulose-6-phosphate isomerase